MPRTVELSPPSAENVKLERFGIGIGREAALVHRTVEVLDHGCAGSRRGRNCGAANAASESVPGVGFRASPKRHSSSTCLASRESDAT